MSHAPDGCCRILQVESNRADAETVERVLARLNPRIRVDTARDGAIALDRLGVEPCRGMRPSYDLVLLGLPLPERNGHEVLEHMAGDPCLAPVPVAVVSGGVEAAELQACYELGACDHVRKSPDLASFQAELDELIKRWVPGPDPVGARWDIAADTGEPAPPPERSLLLVTESRPDRERILRYLRALEGVALRTAESAAEADAELAREPADVVILDRRLPAAGPAYLQRLRGRHPETGVILLTGTDGRPLPSWRADDALPRHELDGPQLYASVRNVLEETVRRQVQAQDGVTGLYGRKRFRARLTDQLRRLRRYGVCFGLLAIELDGLAAIRCERGPGAADRAARQVAERIRRAVRRCDFAARCGPEQFVVIAPDAPGKGVAALSERLRRRIAAAPFEDRGCRLALTASIGLATFAAPPEVDSDEALLIADRAREAARRRGGDIVERVSADAPRSRRAPLDSAVPGSQNRVSSGPEAKTCDSS